MFMMERGVLLEDVMVKRVTPSRLFSKHKRLGRKKGRKEKKKKEKKKKKKEKRKKKKEKKKEQKKVKERKNNAQLVTSADEKKHL